MLQQVDHKMHFKSNCLKDALLEGGYFWKVSPIQQFRIFHIDQCNIPWNIAIGHPYPAEAQNNMKTHQFF